MFFIFFLQKHGLLLLLWYTKENLTQRIFSESLVIRQKHTIFVYPFVISGLFGKEHQIYSFQIPPVG